MNTLLWPPMRNPKEPRDPKASLIWNWLSGTTCWSYARKHENWLNHTRVLVTEVTDEQAVMGLKEQEFWLLKHPGHTAYVDRCAGNAYCGTYHALYDLNRVTEYQLSYGPSLGGGEIKVWHGRWTKAHEKEMLDLVRGLSE